MTVLIISAGGAAAAPQHKSPKECNSELYARIAAIRAAGETPAQFVHDCWWHAQAGQPTAIATARQDAPREAEAAPPEPRLLPRPSPHVRVAQARHVEKLRRRVARLVRAAHVRTAFGTTKRARVAELDSRRARRARWRIASNEPTRRHDRRVRLAAVRPIRETAARSPRAAPPAPPSTVAGLGPSARAGQRMWVRVVAAGEVKLQPAVAIGGLPERTASASALNCWGQPVLFVGHETQRWSRSMVCDGKPAGTNEWSAEIYYGGPAR